MTVHEPGSLAALTALLQEEPESLLIAGGTQVMRSAVRHDGGRALVSLRRVESLARVNRSQRFLDVGAMMPLSRVLSIGPRVVPRSLFAALKATASPTVRVLATLGGNICSPGVEHTSLAALAALEAVLELRLGQSVRLMPASLFWRGGNDRAIQPGELLTRVRLPLEELGLDRYAEESIWWRGSVVRVGFAAVAGVRKGTVEELRFCFSSPWFGTLRFGDFEAACSGIRLPVRERSLEELLSVLKRALVQRLAAPMPEVTPIILPVLRQAEQSLGLLSRGGEPPPGRRFPLARELLED